MRSSPSNFPISARSPRSLTLSTGSWATSSMKRTHRVQRMQRFGDVHHVAAEVLDRIEALRLAIPPFRSPFLERVVLKLALAGLIADRAVERMIDEQHLEHAFARLERLVRVDVHHLSLRRRRSRTRARASGPSRPRRGTCGTRPRPEVPGGSSSAGSARRPPSPPRGSTCPRDGDLPSFDGDRDGGGRSCRCRHASARCPMSAIRCPVMPPPEQGGTAAA